MNTLFVCVMLLAVTSSVLARRCRPGLNCKRPTCRCWMDRSIPGDLNKMETPQMVLLTFGNSINTHTKKNSIELMNGISNPNRCPATATFFIEDLNTDPIEVKKLYDAGFEIGLSTANDTVPKYRQDWIRSIGRVKSSLMSVGIPSSEFRGFRAAQLFAGGDDVMDVLPSLGVAYDTTCVNAHYIDEFNLLWPYTYDFPSHAPHCSIGSTPKHPHNGTWQFLVATLTLEVNGTVHNCPSTSSCSPYLKTVEDVFQFLFSNFLKHYNGNKAPFNLYIDPLWLTEPVQAKGTRQFLEFLQAISDVWMLTFQQALDWIKYPVNKNLAKHFKKWGCNGGAHAARKSLLTN